MPCPNDDVLYSEDICLSIEKIYKCRDSKDCLPGEYKD